MKRIVILFVAQLVAFVSFGQTLQTVTDNGNTTNNPIKIGDGTNNSSFLTVNLQNGGAVLFEKSGSRLLYVGSDANAFGQGSDDALAYVYGNNRFSIATNAARRFSVTGNGTTLIGKTLPIDDETSALIVNGVLKFGNNDPVTVRSAWLAYNHLSGNYKPAGVSFDNNASGARGMALYNSGMGTGAGASFQGKVFEYDGFHMNLLPDGYGNVGIGTATPSSKLTIDPNGGGGIIIGNSNTASGGYTSLAIDISANKDGYSRLQSIKSSGISYGDIFLNPSGGNVGIGTNDSKGYKLAVNGNMIAEQVTVKLKTNWPDYVFTQAYKLPSLQETEQHIKEKGHLPGIPSAEEVKNNGVDLGEMNAKLLQKIEELTLHLIELKKENEEAKRRIEKLENK